MMKYILMVTSIFCLQLVMAQSDAAVGKWQTDGGKSHVEIYEQGGELYGKIVWLAEPNNDAGNPKKDVNNPDKEKRSRTIKGLELLRGFEYAGDNEWEDGEIYDPESGKTYSCEMALEDNGRKLKVRGYLGISLLGRTTTWTRVE